MTNQIEPERVVQAKEKYWSELLAKPNVVGVGIGMKEIGGEKTGEMSMVVMVRQKLPLEGLRSGVAVPAVVDGVPTDVIEVGDLRALQSRTDRWRPAWRCEYRPLPDYRRHPRMCVRIASAAG
jgi:hypothetical protein